MVGDLLQRAQEVRVRVLAELAHGQRQDSEVLALLVPLAREPDLVQDPVRAGGRRGEDDEEVRGPVHHAGHQVLLPLVAGGDVVGRDPGPGAALLEASREPVREP